MSKSRLVSIIGLLLGIALTIFSAMVAGPYSFKPISTLPPKPVQSPPEPIQTTGFWVPNSPASPLLTHLELEHPAHDAPYVLKDLTPLAPFRWAASLENPTGTTYLFFNINSPSYQEVRLGDALDGAWRLVQADSYSLTLAYGAYNETLLLSP